MRPRAWLVYLSGGSAALLTFLFVPGMRQGGFFNLIALSSPVAIVVAVRMWKPGFRLPWYLFAVGLLLFVVGDVLTYNHDLFFGTELPFPSVGDVPYLAVYPCLIAGMLLLIRRRNPGRDRASLIDSLIVAIGVGVISWVFLLAPLVADTEITLAQRLVSMAYPFMDLMLLTVVVRLAIGPGRRGLAFTLLPAAALTLFVTDFMYGYISVQGQIYDQAGYLEAGWGIFYLLWGAAALHGSMRRVPDRAPERELRITRGRLALLGTAALIPQVVPAIQLVRHEAAAGPVITFSTAALFLLVVARMAGLVHKLELSFSREKALRAAGAALGTATDRDAIYAAAMRAVRTLAADGRGRLLVHLDSNDADELTVVAASEGDEGVIGRTVAASGPGGAPRAPLGQRSTDADATGELIEVLELPASATSMLTIPLFMRGEMDALLVVAAPEKLPRATRDGLETLSSQVALALESAALTEDLVRRRSEARFSSLVQHSSDVVAVVDRDSTIRYLSPSADRVLGYEASDLEGTKLTSLIHEDDRSHVLEFLTTGSRETEAHPALTEFRMRHQDGHWLHAESLRTDLLHDQNVKGIVLNTRDVSERKEFEAQLQHQAFHDAVTGLANRALFKDRVEHSFERQARDERPVSILFMDLDDFKTINDSLGHAAGDRLLAEVGERVKGCLRQADTAARLGGDEFAILLEDGGDGVEAAARILASLDRPFHLEGKEVFVRASIGIAGADARTTGPEGAEKLLRNADVAMYKAKEAGKGRYQVYEPATHDTALERLELKADLQRAVDNGEFILHYQPVIELEGGRVEGLEALVRWQHPARGLVAPLEFIPLAEETGLIVPIGAWVLHEACARARELQERYPNDPALTMSVNLSARQLQRQEIVGEIARALIDADLEPSSLVLEITESVMMLDMDLSIQRLTELKELGVKLAVDDFGTGYSSLNYVRRFPIDILKVDKSFIDGVSQGGEESALTAAIIELAEILGLRPVAEGIERADQLEKLLALRCDLGQGFYFAEPLPLSGIHELLSARRSLAGRETELPPGPRSPLGRPSSHPAPALAVGSDEVPQGAHLEVPPRG